MKRPRPDQLPPERNPGAREGFCDNDDCLNPIGDEPGIYYCDECTAAFDAEMTRLEAGGDFDEPEEASDFIVRMILHAYDALIDGKPNVNEATDALSAALASLRIR